MATFLLKLPEFLPDGYRAIIFGERTRRENSFFKLDQVIHSRLRPSFYLDGDEDDVIHISFAIIRIIERLDEINMEFSVAGFRIRFAVA